MSKLIAIDNGHGISTGGKRTPKIPGGRVIHEWEFNHPTAKKLEAGLKRCGFRTLMVSDTSADTPLSTRVSRANNAKADAFMSIHYNALAGVWGTHGGVETYSNTGSVAGAKLAKLVQNELIKATGLRNRGAKTSGFYVLRRTNMAAILAECGFMDNLAEAKLMLDASYQAKCAEAMVKAACSYFGVKYVSPSGNVTTQTPSGNVYYGPNSPHNTKGAIVKLQEDLISLGYSFGKWGADGSFGPATTVTVKKFQNDNKLSADGLADKDTLDRIEELKKPSVSTDLYRVRLDWKNADSQKGAFAELENAKEEADKHNGYKVYNEKGEQVYPELPKEIRYFRVRKSWADEASQKGAFEELENAIDVAKRSPGYNVYDYKGVEVYKKKDEVIEVAPIVPKPKPIVPKPVPKPESIVPKPKPVAPKPEPAPVEEVSIEGKSTATAKQMAQVLLKRNPEPKIFIPALEFCQLFLDEGHIENIRGDIAFCQAMKETGWLRFGGQVLPEQNNYAGIGATNNSPTGKGAWFEDAQEGIRAQIQHLKAYANSDPIVSEVNVDPRFHLVTPRGKAPNWIDLNGKWAVPGTTYGQDILGMFDVLIKEKVGETIKPSDNGNNLVELRKELAEQKKLNATYKKNLDDLRAKLKAIRDIIK